MCGTQQEELLLKIEGRLDTSNFNEYEKYIYQYAEKKCHYSNRVDDKKYIMYKCIVDSLNKNIQKLEKEISIRLIEKLYQNSNQHNIHINVKLNFQVGSLEWVGLLSYLYDTVEIAANIGGAVGFINLVKDIVNKSISEYVIDELRSSSNYNYNSIYDATHTDIHLVSHKVVKPIDSNSKIKELFSLDKILITITLVNIILFLGGTISSSATLTTIAQQYKESQKTIQESQNKYTEAKYNLKSLKDDLDASKDEIDKLIIKELKNYSLNTHKKFKPLIAQINNELNGYEEQINLIEAKSKTLNNKIDKLETLNIKADALYKQSVKYANEIELIGNKLYSRKNTVLYDFLKRLFINGDLSVKIIMGLLFLYLLVPLFMIYSYMIAPLFKLVYNKASK